MAWIREGANIWPVHDSVKATPPHRDDFELLPLRASNACAPRARRVRAAGAVIVLERAPHLGVGIDESTALIVEPGGRWRVAGARVAVVYDARRARLTPAGATLGATGIMMHVLPAGARFDPQSGTATLP